MKNIEIRVTANGRVQVVENPHWGDSAIIWPDTYKTRGSALAAIRRYERGEMEATQRRYQSGLDYACGYHD